MAKVLLSISECWLADVVRVIRAGLVAVPDLDPDAQGMLVAWCEDQEEYMGTWEATE